MLRDFGRFLLAVWNAWAVLLTGGSIIAGLALLSTITGKPTPRSVNWLVLGLTLVIAAFLAWRKEWIANGKEFVNITPLQLAILVRDVTEMAAASRLRPYNNRLIKVTGTLRQVSRQTFLTTYVSVKYVDGSLTGIAINMMLPRWKAKLFVPLSSGTVVTVAGRIKKVDSYQIQLAYGEFISTEVPPTSIRGRSGPLP